MSPATTNRGPTIKPPTPGRSCRIGAASDPSPSPNATETVLLPDKNGTHSTAATSAAPSLLKSARTNSSGRAGAAYSTAGVIVPSPVLSRTQVPPIVRGLTLGLPRTVLTTSRSPSPSKSARPTSFNSPAAYVTGAPKPPLPSPARMWIWPPSPMTRSRAPSLSTRPRSIEPRGTPALLCPAGWNEPSPLPRATVIVPLPEKPVTAIRSGSPSPLTSRMWASPLPVVATAGPTANVPSPLPTSGTILVKTM